MLNEQNQNDPELTNEQVISLVIRYLDENLSEAELLNLNTILRNNAYARELFVRHLTHEACLSELHCDELHNDGLRCDENQESLDTLPDIAGEICQPNVAAPSAHHISELLIDPSAPGGPPTISPNPPTFLNGWSIGLFSLVVLLAGLLTYQLRSTTSDTVHRNEIATNPSAAHSPTDPLGIGPLEIRTINVQSGSGRFTLPRIGYLVTEGPTDLEMIGPLQAKLNYGKIKVSVTEKTGLGFSVETPDGKVTDLGTEFLLDVSPGKKSSVSVLNGKVNLQVATDQVPLDETPFKLLNQGDGVIFCKGGEIERLMSIVTAGDALLRPTASESKSSSGIITEVSDNLGTSETKKFYEIMTRGLHEDSLAYVDRPQHEWNGCERTKPIPSYLSEADYVKTFNEDKIHPDLEIKLTVNEPCDLYIFLDARLQLPSWVYRDYVNTGDLIGMDYVTENEQKRNYKNGVGPGRSINNTYTIWKRRIDNPGVVTLGSNFEKGAVNFQSKNIDDSTMYGIAAVPLKKSPAKSN